MARQDSPDSTDPALSTEPAEKNDAAEATEPTDRIDPAEPIDRIEPDEPMDRMEPDDPMLRIEPLDPDWSREARMTALSQHHVDAGQCGRTQPEFS